MSELKCRECGEKYGMFYKNSDGSHVCFHCYTTIKEQKEKEEKEKEFEEYQIWHNIFRK